MDLTEEFGESCVIVLREVNPLYAGDFVDRTNELAYYSFVHDYDRHKNVLTITLQSRIKTEPTE